jgi:hypothetical protein
MREEADLLDDVADLPSQRGGVYLPDVGVAQVDGPGGWFVSGG